MLRFIVYRYIFYKDSKISHASLLALRHHLSQLPPALLPTSQPHDLHLPYSCTCPTTHLIAPPALLHTALRPASTLLHPALLPTSLPYDLHTTSPCPTPPSSTPHLTTLPPAHDLLHPALLPTSLPLHLHTTYPTTRLSIPDPTTLPMCTLHPYLLLRSHRLHLLSRTPYTRATLHTSLPISPTDVPCHPYIL